MPQIPQQDALDMINTYRKQRINSAWFPKDIVDFIVKNAASASISGIRAYLGTDPKDGHTTIVLAMTQDKGGVHQDLPNGYFDMSQVCPPNCGNGDAGIQYH